MKNSRKPLIIVSMALLLVVVLAMGGVTFAKYISTTGMRTNQANVAKWGFTMSVDATNMFNNNYKSATDNLSVVAEDGTVIVSASADVNVIAPGSKGSMNFSIHGDAEVRSYITVDATCEDIVLYEDGAAVYKPVVWTLTRDGSVVDSLEDVNITEIVAYLDAMDAYIEANNAYALEGDYVLSWEWAWEGNDVYDTALGMFAAETHYVAAATGVGQPASQGYDIAEGAEPRHAGTTLEIAFNMQITIQQVQVDAAP